MKQAKTPDLHSFSRYLPQGVAGRVVLGCWGVVLAFGLLTASGHRLVFLGMVLWTLAGVTLWNLVREKRKTPTAMASAAVMVLMGFIATGAGGSISHTAVAPSLSSSASVSSSESPSATPTPMRRHGLNEYAEKVADEDYDALMKLGALSAAMPDRVEGKLDLTAFIRDGKTSDITRAHYVEGKEAWESGLFALETSFLSGYLSDPLNLVEGDLGHPTPLRRGLAHQWLPADPGMRCLYVARQVKVKTKYGLGTTLAERDALKKELKACADRRNEERMKSEEAQRAAEGTQRNQSANDSSEQRSARNTQNNTGSSGGGNSAPAAPAHNNPAPPPPPAPEPAQPAEPRPRADMTYANCTEVWNALGRPIHRGEAGYAPHLDKDGDGVGGNKRPRH